MSRNITVLLVISASISIIAICLGLIVTYAVLFAPAPQSFEVLPVPLASNPQDVDHYDFGNLRPQLRPGDQLVGLFSVCYQDMFRGPTVDISSQRAIVTLAGGVKAPLNPVDLTMPVGCHATPTLIDTIPNPFPAGLYRVRGTSLSSATYYSRKIQWLSVVFEVAASQ